MSPHFSAPLALSAFLDVLNSIQVPFFGLGLVATLLAFGAGMEIRLALTKPQPPHVVKKGGFSL
ncbi:MAG: hypothetical protein HC848_02285 [Limnobacter sp.]|nr:hypothetical protein [Limnobacter sp.]